jgi:GMP synthase (glutamine-hydrolysing)
MARAAVIRHVAFEDAGLLGPLLEKRGLEVLDLDAATDDLEPVEDADLLVVLGGPISVNDVWDYPFIDTELALLKARLAADRPTLGICLGAQLMAKALGAAVKPNGGKEIGWAPLELTEDGGILSELADVPVLHWHGEVFDLPQGARLLAKTAMTPHQAFSWGARALALQFHPEVTARGLERWFVGHTGEIAATPGIDVRSLRDATATHAPMLLAAGTRFFEQWLASVL